MRLSRLRPACQTLTNPEYPSHGIQHTVARAAGASLAMASYPSSYLTVVEETKGLPFGLGVAPRAGRVGSETTPHPPPLTHTG